MTASRLTPIRVLLVEDHQLLTDLLAQVLGREPDVQVVGVAASVSGAREFARDRRDVDVDVILLDFRLPDGTGVDAIRAMKDRWPAARIVMLTAVADDETILEAIQAGADGYLTKDRALDEIVGAVRAVHAGETLLPRSVILVIAHRVAEARQQGRENTNVEPLTPRELDVLQALAQGLSSQEISEQLRIAPNTFRTHVQNIMAKLRVHSKLEAVAFALRHRLVEPPKVTDSLR